MCSFRISCHRYDQLRCWQVPAVGDEFPGFTDSMVTILCPLCCVFCPLWSVLCRLCSVLCRLCSVLSLTLWSVLCRLCSVLCRLYSDICPLCSVLSPLCSVLCRLCSVLSLILTIAIFIFTILMCWLLLKYQKLQQDEIRLSISRIFVNCITTYGKKTAAQSSKNHFTQMQIQCANSTVFSQKAKEWDL